MKRILFAVTSVLALTACTQPKAIPAADRFGDAMAGVDKALTAKIAPQARAALEAQRQKALAEGKPLAPLPSSCFDFYTRRDGAVLQDCPGHLDIVGFVPASTPEIEAERMLRIYLAFGGAIKALADPDAAKARAEAVKTFAANAKGLASELEVKQAELLFNKAQANMEPLQAVITALTRIEQAQSICQQIRDGQKAFYGANQRLAVYVETYVDRAPGERRAGYTDAKLAGDDLLADREYDAWLKALRNNPLLTALDASATAFNATLAACGTDHKTPQ